MHLGGKVTKGASSDRNKPRRSFFWLPTAAHSLQAADKNRAMSTRLWKRHTAAARAPKIQACLHGDWQTINHVSRRRFSPSCSRRAAVLPLAGASHLLASAELPCDRRRPRWQGLCLSASTDPALSLSFAGHSLSWCCNVFTFPSGERQFGSTLGQKLDNSLLIYNAI